MSTDNKPLETEYDPITNTRRIVGDTPVVQAQTVPAGAIHPSPDEFTEAELAVDPILRFFHYKHLPPVLREVSAPFCQQARGMIDHLPRNAERTVALRKLLEAKDCAVRASLPTP